MNGQGGFRELLLVGVGHDGPFQISMTWLTLKCGLSEVDCWPGQGPYPLAFETTRVDDPTTASKDSCVWPKAQMSAGRSAFLPPAGGWGRIRAGMSERY